MDLMGGGTCKDGARVHTASSTMADLTTMGTVIDNWPACSPDLNPIEDFWVILKRRVEELQPVTKDHLIEILIDGWEHLEMGIVNAMVD
jgi:transposase